MLIKLFLPQRNLSCHIDTLGKRKCNSWKKLLKSNYKLSPIPRYLECHSQLELGFWIMYIQDDANSCLFRMSHGFI